MYLCFTELLYLMSFLIDLYVFSKTQRCLNKDRNFADLKKKERESVWNTILVCNVLLYGY